jgi:hypothetical protein
MEHKPMPDRVQELSKAIEVLRRSIDTLYRVTEDLRSISGTAVEILLIEETVDELHVSVGMAYEEFDKLTSESES